MDIKNFMFKKNLIDKKNLMKNSSNSSNSNKFITIKNMCYLLLISFIISAILINLLGIKSVRNYFELFIIVAIVSGFVLKEILKDKNMNLDLLENKTIIVVLAIILGAFFFILFTKFTSIDTYSTEGMIHAIIFCLLVFAFINFIFLFIGLAN